MRKYAVYAQGNRLMDIATYRPTRTDRRENYLYWSPIIRMGILWQKIKRENNLQMKHYKGLIGLVLIHAVWLAYLLLTSCGVTYKGKYGTYTATPSGAIIIEPKYAK